MRSKTTVFYEEFYQKMGYLCYAVATADYVLTASEKRAIKKLVKESWLTFEGTNDSYGTDASYEIISVFDWLVEEKFSTEESYIVFEDFYQENIAMFDDDLKKMIIQTATEISAATGDCNKKELQLLNKLHDLLYKHP